MLDAHSPHNNSESGANTIAPKRPLIIDGRDIHVYYQMPSVKRTTLKETVIAKIKGLDDMIVTKALDGVSISAHRGECLALIGHNGCGKSTLLKVLAGILKPVKGSAHTIGRVAPLIELGAGFDPELSGRENVFLSCSLMGLTRREIISRMESIAKFSELGNFFDAPVKTYSSGMYMRLGFACTTAIDADLLLIDEILAVGDENFQRKCIRRMNEIRASGVTIILVTHDLNVVRTMADRALVLDHGKLYFEGNAREAVDRYLELMENERIAAMPVEERLEELRRKNLLKNDAENQEKAKYLGGIMTAEVFGPDGVNGYISSQKPWSIEFEIRVHEILPKPVVTGFSINTLQGQRIYGSNTLTLPHQNENLQKMRFPGTYRVRFDCTHMPLASGRYALAAALHTHTLEQTICIHAHAALFNVYDHIDQNNFDADLINFDALKISTTIKVIGSDH